MSEQGIERVVAHWRRWHANDASRSARQRAVDGAVGSAVYAEPIDINQVDRALADKRRQQTDWNVEHDADTIALLRELGPADQKLIAHKLTAMRPAIRLPVSLPPVRR